MEPLREYLARYRQATNRAKGQDPTGMGLDPTMSDPGLLHAGEDAFPTMAAPIGLGMGLGVGVVPGAGIAMRGSNGGSSGGGGVVDTDAV